MPLLHSLALILHGDQIAEFGRTVEAILLGRNRVKAASIIRLDMDKLAAETVRSGYQLDRLAQATLAKAFRGELAPQDPNDEPASALLERLRAEPGERKMKRRGRSAKS